MVRGFLFCVFGTRVRVYSRLRTTRPIPITHTRERFFRALAKPLFAHEGALLFGGLIVEDRITIAIVGVDKSSSRPPAGGHGRGSAIGTMALELSPTAPSAWQEIFNISWKQHFYMMKRHAVCTGRLITVECPPAELEGGLLDELAKVVSETNRQYAQHQQRVQQSRAREEAQAAAAKAGLDAVADRLNSKLGR